MIKVYIPSHNRANDITTHKVFLERPDLFNVMIVVNKGQKQGYINAGIDESIITEIDAKSLCDARQWIYNQNEYNEWFISADDDLTGIYVNKTNWKTNHCEKYKYELDNNFFFEKIPEIINTADFINAYTIGFAMVKNEFFNQNKYTEVGHIMNTLVFWKRQKQIDWFKNYFKDAMEEMNITAQHHLFNGKVLRCHYVTTDAKHYQKGGIGEITERKPKKIEESNKLLNYYQGFFRPKNDDDVSVAFTNTIQVKKWRLQMILSNKLPIEYASQILKGKELERFLSLHREKNKL